MDCDTTQQSTTDGVIRWDYGVGDDWIALGIRAVNFNKLRVQHVAFDEDTRREITIFAPQKLHTLLMGVEKSTRTYGWIGTLQHVKIVCLKIKALRKLLD